MFWLGRIWKWGVVAPVTALAFAGAIADIVTNTVDYWYLLAPSYFVIAISVWNGMSDRAEARRRAAAEASGEEDENVVASGKPTSPSIVEIDDPGVSTSDGDD